MSICLAASAFADTENDEPTKYETQSRNVQALMDDIGFDIIEINDNYKKKPTTSSIGVAIGLKSVL